MAILLSCWCERFNRFGFRRKTLALFELRRFNIGQNMLKYLAMLGASDYGLFMLLE